MWNNLPVPDGFTDECLFRFDGFLGDEYRVCRFQDLIKPHIEYCTGWIPLRDVLKAVEK